jgi:signal peptidase II
VRKSKVQLLPEESFLRSYARIAWLIVLGLVLLFLDFLSKAYVYYLLPPTASCFGESCRSIPVFYNFAGIDFLISFAMNKGAAWGFFAGFQIPLLILRILVVLGIFMYLFFINHNPHIDMPLILIIAGAIGNVVDFFLYGFVVDFLFFNFWGYHFPIFNFADTCITIGVIWLFLINLFAKKHARV